MTARRGVRTFVDIGAGQPIPREATVAVTLEAPGFIEAVRVETAVVGALGTFVDVDAPGSVALVAGGAFA